MSRTLGDSSIYLKKTLKDVLPRALHEVCQVRPADPIEYLAKCLYKSADSCLYFQEKAIFEKEKRKIASKMKKEDHKRKKAIARYKKHIFELKNYLHIQDDVRRSTVDGVVMKQIKSVRRGRDKSVPTSWRLEERRRTVETERRAYSLDTVTPTAALSAPGSGTDTPVRVSTTGGTGRPSRAGTPRHSSLGTPRLRSTLLMKAFSPPSESRSLVSTQRDSISSSTVTQDEQQLLQRSPSLQSPSSKIVSRLGSLSYGREDSSSTSLLSVKSQGLEKSAAKVKHPSKKGHSVRRMSRRPESEIVHEDSITSDAGVSRQKASRQEERIIMKKTTREEDESSRKMASHEEDGISKKKTKREEGGISKKKGGHEEGEISMMKGSHEEDGIRRKKISHEEVGISRKKISHEEDGISRKKISHEEDGISRKKISHEEDGISRKKISHEEDGISRKKISHEEDGISRKKISLEEDRISRKKISHEEDRISGKKESPKEVGISRKKEGREEDGIGRKKRGHEEDRISRKKESPEEDRISERKESPEEDRISRKKESPEEDRISERKESPEEDGISGKKESPEEVEISRKKGGREEVGISRKKGGREEGGISKKKGGREEGRISRKKEGREREEDGISKKIASEEDGVSKKIASDEEDEISKKIASDEEDEISKKIASDEEDEISLEEESREEDKISQKKKVREEDKISPKKYGREEDVDTNLTISTTEKDASNDDSVSSGSHVSTRRLKKKKTAQSEVSAKKSDYSMEDDSETKSVDGVRVERRELQLTKKAKKKTTSQISEDVIFRNVEEEKQTEYFKGPEFIKDTRPDYEEEPTDEYEEMARGSERELITPGAMDDKTDMERVDIQEEAELGKRKVKKLKKKEKQTVAKVRSSDAIVGEETTPRELEDGQELPGKKESPQIAGSGYKKKLTKRGKKTPVRKISMEDTGEGQRPEDEQTGQVSEPRTPGADLSDDHFTESESIEGGPREGRRPSMSVLRKRERKKLRSMASEIPDAQDVEDKDIVIEIDGEIIHQKGRRYSLVGLDRDSKRKGKRRAKKTDGKTSDDDEEALDDSRKQSIVRFPGTMSSEPSTEDLSQPSPGPSRISLKKPKSAFNRRKSVTRDRKSFSFDSSQLSTNASDEAIGQYPEAEQASLTLDTTSVEDGLVAESISVPQVTEDLYTFPFTPVECEWFLVDRRTLVCRHPVLGDIRARPTAFSAAQTFVGWPDRFSYSWRAFYDPEVYTVLDPHLHDTKYKRKFKDA